MAMANLRSVGNLFSGGSLSSNNANNNQTFEDVVHRGYLIKKKNMRKRFCVLRKETSRESLARLEYYETEKKYNDAGQPRKKYLLNSCKMICCKKDSKGYGIGLYLQKENVSFIADTEADRRKWLTKLNNLKWGTSCITEGHTRVEYEHVWPVDIPERSLARVHAIAGQQLLCLTNSLLSLVKPDTVNNEKVSFQLEAIRRCGNVNEFFFIELGNSSPIGSGLLWMKSEDALIALNMHEIVGNVMNHVSGNNTLPRDRTRSVSDAQRIDHPAHRSRSDSVPTNAKGHSKVMSKQSFDSMMKSPMDSSRPFPIRESENDSRIHRSSFGSPGSNDSAESSSEEESTPRYPTMDVDDIERYIQMHPSEIAAILSPANMTRNTREAVGYGHSEYVSMEMDELDEIGHQASNSLHLPLSDIAGSYSQCQLTPVSPNLRGAHSPFSRGLLPSPSHSRNSLTLEDTHDGYTTMFPPGSFCNAHSNATSPYLEMGPVIEKRSAPTPIPVSPSDGDSYNEMFSNSGSSSFTSGDLGSGLSQNLSGEEMDSLEMRPVRTNSVGSKPDQYKRKNRLETVTIEEPARVRAFSVGSRVSLKFGVGRLGGTHPCEPPTDNLGELFPSIKETGKQAKNKSSSAPMLGSSPVSHSWSGTPGSYFRGLFQSRNQQQRDPNLMELDFSKNKSYDYIPGEDKDRKTSKERIWSTLKSHRQRSNSKSSGNSKSSEGDTSNTKRLSESETRGVEIPTVSADRSEYFEMDFNPSPRSTGSDSCKGYLMMHPPTSSYLSTTQANESTETNRRRQVSLNEPYCDMSTSSCAPQEGYVDMSQGNGSSGALTLTSSSSTRKMSNLFAPMASQEQLHSPLEDFMDLDLQAGSETFSNRKSKRKSFKESAKRKKSDSVSSRGDNDSPDTSHKSKTSNALTTLTNFIRKPSSKAPLSPQMSSHSKVAKESVSPFSSLSRIKSREDAAKKNEYSSLEGHRRVNSMSSDNFSTISKIPPSSDRNSLSGSIDIGTHISMNRDDEMMLFDPVEASKRFGHSNKTDSSFPHSEKRMSSYMNLNLEDETTCGSLPSLNVAMSPVSHHGSYMNMQPGKSSPQLSPPAKKEKPNPSITEEDNLVPVTTNDKESSYMMMNAPTRTKVNFSSVTQRPTIPSSLLSTQSPSLALEKLAINEQTSSERSRSHSGPEGGSSDKSKKRDEGRASSACSSPISYSPPTSPTHGSVSSLSEGGLSSASSTCTVVNVGLVRQPQSGLSKSASPSDSCTGISKAAPIETSSCSKDDNALNYVSLDLSEENKKPSPKLLPKNSLNKPKEDANMSYVTIDFTKSEGLRNTSLARDASRPH